MIADGDDIILVWCDKKPYVFNCFIEQKISSEKIKWLHSSYPTFGTLYYYSDNKIWFTEESHLLHYLLVFPD